MATTPNYGFIMPDPTDFVTNLPADFEIFGDEVDSRIKALNPETTAGDISYRGATANAKVRLGIGTAGQVLRVNSGATAPEWGTVSTPAPNFTLVNTGGTTLTGATTITVSGISGADQILVVFQSVEGGLFTDFGIQLNTDTGSNYYRYGQQFNGESTYNRTNWTSLQGAGTNIPIFRSSSNGGTNGAGYVLFAGCNSSGKKPFTSVGAWNSAAAEYRNYYLGGYYDGSSTISSVSIMKTGGNFTGGTIWVYTSA